MHKLMDLKEELCKELETYAGKGEMTTSDLDAIDKLSHSLKSIETILAMEGYSNDYAQDHGMSMRSRDDMGRYSRTYPMPTYGRGGYSYGENPTAQNLRDMMNNASSEQERAALARCLDSLNY